jgi:hypothetical protein
LPPRVERPERDSDLDDAYEFTSGSYMSTVRSHDDDDESYDGCFLYVVIDGGR